jgi:hypothetical protein
MGLREDTLGNGPVLDGGTVKPKESPWLAVALTYIGDIIAYQHGSSSVRSSRYTVERVCSGTFVCSCSKRTENFIYFHSCSDIFVSGCEYNLAL